MCYYKSWSDNYIYSKTSRLFKIYMKLTIYTLLFFITSTITITASSSLKQYGVKNLTVAFLASFKLTRPNLKGPVIAGAMSYAAHVINKDTNLLPGYRIQFIPVETGSDALVGIKKMSELWKNGVAAFFGPEDSCDVEGRVASAWNLPMFAYKCSSTEVSDKKRFPTFIRTSPPSVQVTKSIVSLLLHYDWRRFSLLVGSSPEWEPIANNLEETAGRLNLTLNHRLGYQEFSYKPKGEGQSIAQVVEATYVDTRVYVFLGKNSAMVHLLQELEARDLLRDGQYVVIHTDLNSLHKSNPLTYFSDEYSSPFEQLNVEASRSLLVIVPSSPDDFDHHHNFTLTVDDFNQMAPFYFHNPTGIPVNVSPYAEYLYDAVMLYARAITEVLKSGGNIYNGSNIVSKIFGRTYFSSQGFSSHIDHQGDAEGNYTVLSRAFNNMSTPVQSKSPELQFLFPGMETPVINFTMAPAGMFRLMKGQPGLADQDSGLNLPEFVLMDKRSIDWPGGRPPLDMPVCGYRNELCIQPTNFTTEIAAGVLAGLALLSCIISLIAYRNWRYEQEIAGLLWKVKLEDLHGFGKGIHGSRITLMSAGSGDHSLNQVFTCTARYRGQVVAVKRIYRRGADMTRDMRKEMKLMREMRHDNVNTFIGACCEAMEILLLSEYCAKGSLQDILENDDVKLDSMFIASLVMDLIKGMLFIHESELKVHGNLKSSNCLVTSRWTLQVSDFGLCSLRRNQNSTVVEIENDYSSHRNLLWTAPEHLRLRGIPGVHGNVLCEGLGGGAWSHQSQKGDIYSFSIVLYEIIGRSGPYGDTNLSPAEILQRVKDIPEEMKGPFRPDLSALDCQDYIRNCIRDCWTESPASRPDFHSIRSRLKPMTSGMKRNIFDNMLLMMEKYQHRLEDLVAERTGLLIDEKKKTEALLLRMLPKSVVDQLVQGKAVSPESFSCVTIYFSDICGFTALSAESTPMQVVDLLNDLYTLFDSVISNYDVYKVETIGDAYMVVSGLPVRNGDSHAGEVASMSLALLEAIKSFRIRSRPDETLKLRIGIHSGSCVAGVVGLTMPRYCLFGDTVNTASRMESNGEALRIHMSESCKQLLDGLGGYVTEPRGHVAMKGKGEQFTYWLLGENTAIRTERLKQTQATPCTHKKPDVISGRGQFLINNDVISDVNEIVSKTTMNTAGKNDVTFCGNAAEERKKTKCTTAEHADNCNHSKSTRRRFRSKVQSESDSISVNSAPQITDIFELLRDGRCLNSLPPCACPHHLKRTASAVSDSRWRRSPNPIPSRGSCQNCARGDEQGKCEGSKDGSWRVKPAIDHNVNYNNKREHSLKDINQEFTQEQDDVFMCEQKSLMSHNDKHCNNDINRVKQGKICNDIKLYKRGKRSGDCCRMSHGCHRSASLIMTSTRGRKGLGEPSCHGLPLITINNCAAEDKTSPSVFSQLNDELELDLA